MVGPVDDLDPEDFWRRIPMFQGEHQSTNQAIVDVVVRIAGEHGRTPAQVALA